MPIAEGAAIVAAAITALVIACTLTQSYASLRAHPPRFGRTWDVRSAISVTPAKYNSVGGPAIIEGRAPQRGEIALGVRTLAESGRSMSVCCERSSSTVDR